MLSYFMPRNIHDLFSQSPYPCFFNLTEKADSSLGRIVLLVTVIESQSRRTPLQPGS